MKKRNLFDELMQGVDEMAAHREGKITLRQIALEEKPAPQITAAEIISLREKMHMSQAVFARHIRTSTETLRNWEREKAKPNTQAALLIKLVAQYPDMVERLEAV
ncbi:helix-turn-helix domain-containing protein [Marinospirillum sp.]|uniref:helix-turn-helix domain-containing protein n=1 Tax=Marinospirillum sp. TaxID=2183934 RepID=UPI00384BBDDE